MSDSARDVSEDPDLTPAEKQVAFTTTKADAPAVRFHSEVASVTRALLSHDHTTVENTRMVDGEIVAATGTIPLSCLTVKAGQRASDHFGQVVNTGRAADG